METVASSFCMGSNNAPYIPRSIESFIASRNMGIENKGTDYLSDVL